MHLVTGAAGFIGHHVALRLLERGERVLGLDAMGGAAARLKEGRLARLRARPGFEFALADIADAAALRDALAGRPIRRVAHLAAQAGVRQSIDAPHAFVDANLRGQLNLLEWCRHADGLDAVAYASSSSVYGANAKLPFAESDPTDHPVSLYAATKKGGELMAEAYARLFGIPLTGLRFFTVYGPWGRPDMAMWLWTDAILAGRPIRLFNGGAMRRDFTWVDDIAGGVLLALDTRPPGPVPHRVLNLGNSRPEPLERVVGLIERAAGRPAVRVSEPMQPGDVVETAADLSAVRQALGWEPTTPIEDGVPRFVRWFRDRHGLA